MESNRNITSDIVTEYINRFYEPVSDELGMLRLESEAEKVPIILKETESFLRTFLSITQPKRILEIGCAVGYSAMFFAATVVYRPSREAVAFSKSEIHEEYRSTNRVMERSFVSRSALSRSERYFIDSSLSVIKSF